MSDRAQHPEIDASLNRTALHDAHEAAGGRMVPFAGWRMPVQYQGALAEHNAVRGHAGMFDVSHMQVVDLDGPEVQAFLKIVLANNVERLATPGKALYSCMLNADGGVIDDLIVYWRGGTRYRLVVNAGTAQGDIAWLRQNIGRHAVTLTHRPDLGILAVQGPQAPALLLPLLPAALRDAVSALKPFNAAEGAEHGAEWFVGRTGYTGEDGFEVVVPHEVIKPLWDGLAQAGVVPCGLGARDTLRLEAGMNLYGQDMDATTTPLESNLEWTMSMGAGRTFIGRTVLEEQKERPHRRLAALILDGRGVMRPHMKVRFKAANGETVTGETTSGGFAPTLNRSIAFARFEALPEDVPAGTACEVEIRGQWVAARVEKAPFVRHGKARDGLVAST